MAERVIKVFLASPNDVLKERDAADRLVKNINDVLAFLAPEKKLSIELVVYETHSYPDVGAPQEVINRQIPVDYDVFVGVMWRRCGTPTKNHPSGTIEEYGRACDKRKQHGHLPVVMFYFCDQPIPIPGDEAELAQLSDVVKFRTQLQRSGLVWTYPSHEEFSENLRGGLLKAIRDILSQEAHEPQVAQRAQPENVTDAARTEIARMAAEYERIRATMPSGGERTRRMTAVFSAMKAIAATYRAITGEFQASDSPGRHLAAIAALQMFPDAEQLDWLAGRLELSDIDPAFTGYQAAIALLEATRSLPVEACPAMRAALRKAQSLGGSLTADSDRRHVLNAAEQELKRKCGGGGTGG